MARRKKCAGGPKRTISPEQQAKMQEARKTAAVHRKRMSDLAESGLAVHEDVSRTAQMLDSVRNRRGR